MVKPGYFPTTGKISFTRPAHKISFCEELQCCTSLPENFSMLYQIEVGSSGGNVVLHCSTVSMTKIDGTTWTGTASVSDCFQDLDFVFTCDHQGPANPEDCTQIFSLSVNTQVANIESCCCFDSDSAITGVDEGEWCFVFGLGSIVERDGDGTGCNCNDWDVSYDDQGSLEHIWGYGTDEYGDACCQPSPCPDACCPSNPCSVSMMPPEEPGDIPEDLGWLRDISEWASK